MGFSDAGLRLLYVAVDGSTSNLVDEMHPIVVTEGQQSDEFWFTTGNQAKLTQSYIVVSNPSEDRVVFSDEGVIEKNSLGGGTFRIRSATGSSSGVSYLKFSSFTE